MKTKNTIINHTKNYALFAKHPSNPDSRRTDEKLFRSMQEHGWLDGFPMMVEPNGSTFTIIEGHRRFDTAMKLGIEVKYVIDGLVKMNPRGISEAVKKWDIKDCVLSSAQLGSKDFLELKTFAEENQLSFTTAAIMLSAKMTASADIHNDSFKVRSRPGASLVLSIMKAVRGNGDRARFSWWNSTTLARAVSMVVRYVKDFEPKKMIDKIRTHAALLDLQPTAMDYVEMLDKVYNRHFTNEKLPIKTIVEAGLIKDKQCSVRAAAKASVSKRCTSAGNSNDRSGDL